MSYKINPVKAITNMYKSGDCGIQTVNNACYGICASFNGSNNNWIISPECESQCEKLVNKMRVGKYGVGFCDHHAPNRPVNWGQVPSFFPKNFNECGDVKKALLLSYKDCENTGLPEECKNKALLDSLAVEQYNQVNQVNQKDTNNNSQNNVSNYEKANPLVFWLFFIGATVLVAIVLFIIAKTLQK